MDKEVMLALKGLQFAVDQEGAQALETITPAEYYKKNESHYLIYEEIMEGFAQPTKNVIKIRGSQVEVTKKGVVNVHMVFEENKKNMTSYHTPFGDILIGIDTGAVHVEEEDEEMKVKVQYSLEANYEHMADCKLEMKIQPRESRLDL